ncbi:MAG: trimethylamine methyltransferase family protein [Candidatus Puniceispirillaceae bacterium]
MVRRNTRRAKTQAEGPRKLLDEQLPWQMPRYFDRPTEPLSADQIEAIHEASLDVIEQIGIRFLNETALDHLQRAGCSIDRSDMNVKMDRHWVMEMVRHAPSSFTVTPRNPQRKITVGDGHFIFGQVSSPPNILDSETGRRMGTREDFCNFLHLSQAFNCIHAIVGYPVEPMDLHASVRHLYATLDMLVHTDKVIHGYSLGKERIEDVMEMTRIAAGISHEEFDARPHMFTNINSSSPLKHDYPMLDGAMRLAARNQPVVITPFTLSGAMAPVTIVGAIVQQNAEALAAIALLQFINPGTPVVYGAFTSNVDMKSGAPAFGTPEYVRAMQVSGQMARFYDVPIRSSNANAANVPDGQAVWESAFSLQGAMSGHSNLIYHAAGWLEGGLSASPEKFVMDCEMLQQVTYTQQPLEFDTDALAVEAINIVGPDGHFFGCDHTQKRYKTAFYIPFLSDWSNYESWQEAGAIWTHDRAHTAYKRILEEHQPPIIDPSIKEELEAFVAHRVEEGGAPTDY